MNKLAVATITLAVSVSALAISTPAEAKGRPTWTTNCTALNKTYPHGVGRTNAHDHVSSGRPVTTFRRSNKLYQQAMSYNRGLDRDRDGIACEKA